MGFKTPILCDRRIYDKKGVWKKPQQDLHDNIFYFIKEKLTLVPEYKNGREELRETLTITVFGSKPICAKDKIKLNLGGTETEYEVQQVIPNFIEHNPLVVDLLKPRVASMDIVLA